MNKEMLNEERNAGKRIILVLLGFFLIAGAVFSATFRTSDLTLIVATLLFIFGLAMIWYGKEKQD